MNCDDARERREIIAEYIIKNSATVRGAAAEFGISKSTIHKNMTENLRRENKILYFEVKAVLEKNKKERHIRGGEATKKKYLLKKSADNGCN